MSKKIIKYPVELVLSLLGDKWSILILCKLKKGTIRFLDLQRQLAPISTKVLTAKLQDLEQYGFIHKEIYPVSPPKVEYSLTELGGSLDPIMRAMFDWGMEHGSAYEEWFKIEIDTGMCYPEVSEKVDI